MADTSLSLQDPNSTTALQNLMAKLDAMNSSQNVPAVPQMPASQPVTDANGNPVSNANGPASPNNPIATTQYSSAAGPQMPAPTSIHAYQNGTNTASYANGGFNGNPLTLIGGLVNAVSPNDPTTGKAGTENPDSFISVLKGALPHILQNMPLVNAASELLGLGSTNNQNATGQPDPFAGSNAVATPFDAQIKADMARVNSLQYAAGTGPVGKQMYEGAQQQLTQDEANRQFHLANMQTGGKGTSQQTSDFINEAVSSEGEVQADIDSEKAIQDRDPIEIQTALNEMAKLGNFGLGSKRPGGVEGEILTSSAAGKLPDWIAGQPDPVAAWTTVSGMLKAADRSARNEESTVNRQGEAILPGSSDGSNPENTAKARNLTGWQLYGTPGNGMPDQDKLFKEIDNLNSPGLNSQGKIVQGIEAQRQNQISDISKNIGKGAVNKTGNEIGGVTKGLSQYAIDALNYVHPGAGTALKAEAHALIGGAQAPAPTNAPAQIPATDAQVTQAKTDAANGNLKAQAWLKRNNIQ